MSDSKVRLKGFSNLEYNPGKLLNIAIWQLVSRFFFETRLPIPSKFKRFVLRLFNAKIGSRVVIKPNVKIKYPWFLEVRDDCWIGEKVWIDNLTMIIIENDVCISQNAMLLTGNHDYNSPKFDLLTGNINLKKGVWVGAKSIVCPGVTMADYSILSVGSVLTKDTQTLGIYQGNPAEYKKRRFIREDDNL